MEYDTVDGLCADDETNYFPDYLFVNDELTPPPSAEEQPAKEDKGILEKFITQKMLDDWRADVATNPRRNIGDYIGGFEVESCELTRVEAVPYQAITDKPAGGPKEHVFLVHWGSHYVMYERNLLFDLMTVLHRNIYSVTDVGCPSCPVWRIGWRPSVYAAPPGMQTSTEFLQFLHLFNPL